jgi:outer membrane biosynthesis protein TonB
MQENNHHIKVDGELLHQYHHGKLGNEQKNEIEKIALNDAFVSDALDGFEKDPDALVHIQQLQHKLFLKTKQNRKGIGFYIKPYYPHMAVAATLFVLVFSGYFILIQTSNDGQYTDKKKNLADTTTQLAKVNPSKDEPSITTPKIEKLSNTTPIESVDHFAKPEETKQVVAQEGVPDVQENISVEREPVAQNQKEINQKEAEAPTPNAPKADEAVAYKTIPSTEAVALVAKDERKSTLDSDDNNKNIMVASAKKVKAARAFGNSESRNMTENSTLNNYATVNEALANEAFKVYTQNHPLHCYDASGVEIKGEVKLRFDIDKNGKPENIKVLKSLSPTCDQMAIEQLKNGYLDYAGTRKKREVITIKF